MRYLAQLLCFVGATSAAFVDNLNYLSPSRHHASLGVSISRVAKRTYETPHWDSNKLNFTHGIASGDPSDDSVILWTRAAPTSDNDESNITVSGYVPLYDHSTEEYVLSSNAPVCVDWKIGTSKSLNHIVDSGTVYTSSDIDYTIKVEAKKLKPFTTYSCEACCILVQQLPFVPTFRDDRKVTNRKWAAFGFFNAYGNPVRKDSVDYVLHLGDYIYEYGNGGYGWGDAYGRIPLPNREIHTLYDYRKRLATYRTDLDLVASHQMFPWIPVWDDHEVADNTYRDGSAHLNNTEESFIEDGGVSVDQRKMNAVRAYFEWMPIRQVDMDDNLRIWRNFQFGNLFDLVMLDTRQYDRSITDVYWNTHYLSDIYNDASRSLMGPRQEAWFYKTLQNSAKRGATWRIVGNQVVFSRINASISSGLETPFNYDQWDGYQANRNRTFHTLYENKIGNNIFLAGDSHASWVSDLVWLDEHPYDPSTGEGSIGVEFAGTAVSSPSPAGQNVTLETAQLGSALFIANNAELQWQDFYYRGYFELSISHDKVDAAYFGVPTTTVRSGAEIPLANFTVLAGANKLYRENGAAALGGVVEAGSLRGGKVVPKKLILDTETGKWHSY
ncbi:hypothetical protein GQX73_g7033 [Xylaria multiplex]|uniref:PhoD-like phosphatase metallophosphatase domain-containing protein n=1 Tax=Xylaria multiplex TaxID=323545 RepID=A0A7C8MVJ5_9PEZI|nr:hypothetical protein GQX73_g7033 [Xylaria multiplex]